MKTRTKTERATHRPCPTGPDHPDRDKDSRSPTEEKTGACLTTPPARNDERAFGSATSRRLDASPSSLYQTEGVEHPRFQRVLTSVRCRTPAADAFYTRAVAARRELSRTPSVTLLTRAPLSNIHSLFEFCRRICNSAIVLATARFNANPRHHVKGSTDPRAPASTAIPTAVPREDPSSRPPTFKRQQDLPPAHGDDSRQAHALSDKGEGRL